MLIETGELLPIEGGVAVVVGGGGDRNILTISHIRGTMTETDKLNDLSYQVVYR